MDELIKITKENDRVTILARDLHEFLEVFTPYHKWFLRMVKYGFSENVDFMTVDKKVYRTDGGLMPQTKQDHQITVEMAKEISMIQRSDKGRQARQYFIECEKQLKNKLALPQTYAEALRALAGETEQKEKQKLLTEKALNKIEEDKPKVLFADAVEDSDVVISVATLAKKLESNGIKIGQNRLFEWLRENGYVHKGGLDRNLPTQRSIERNFLTVSTSVVKAPRGKDLVTHTTKVTGKGEIYFISKFLTEKLKENQKTLNI